MADINTGRLPIASVNLPILDELKSAADKQIVSDQLNSVLRGALISAANSRGVSTLDNVLRNLQSPDLAADQNLSLRAFVTKYATIPTDPAANKAAQAAIATLSATTTVGEFLGLDKTVASNPIFRGIVAQTNLAALLSTSPALTAYWPTGSASVGMTCRRPAGRTSCSAPTPWTRRCPTGKIPPCSRTCSVTTTLVSPTSSTWKPSARTGRSCPSASSGSWSCASTAT